MKLGVRIVLECSRFRLSRWLLPGTQEGLSMRAAIDTGVPTRTRLELFARPAKLAFTPGFHGSR